ncbi:MAG: trehalose-6-phosphate synthase [Phycisphaerales bacterium]
MIDARPENDGQDERIVTPVTIVANRLPVRIDEDGSHAISPGGLVSALMPVVRDGGGTWIGWLGTPGDPDVDPDGFVVDGLALRPVPLSEQDIELYYQRFANETLWPLFHDGVRTPDFDADAWEHYVKVNERFARIAAEETERDGVVWVHDYHLLMVPELLKKMRPDIRVGVFLHIPIPPGELFATLPWRQEILLSLASADLVGTQTRVDAENLSRTLLRPSLAGAVDPAIAMHKPKVMAFPISIDSLKYRDAAVETVESGEADELKESFGSGRTLFLGVDRLDYTKGIDKRLEAFEYALEHGMLDPARCAFVQVAVPSRDILPEYQDINDRVDALVGRINGRFGGVAHTVVYYIKRALPFTRLIPLYRAADVMVVTPVRDGMNLVAKEYLATRFDGTGELILSEFAGAARQLSGATLINPYDVTALADALVDAYTRSRETGGHPATSDMHHHVMEHDVHEWAASFLDVLQGDASET